MKVLQVNNYHYIRGGADRVYLETVKLLMKMGHEVTCFSVSDSNAFRDPHLNASIEPVSYDRLSPLNYFLQIPRFFYSHEAKNKLDALLLEIKPDIVHVHIYYGRLTSSILPVLRRHNVPAILTIHEYKRICPAYVMLDGNGKICHRCYGKNYLYCVRHACMKNSRLFSLAAAGESFFRDIFYPYERYFDKFIMVSRYIRDKHLEFLPSWRDKVELLYNFIDIEAYPTSVDNRDYYLYFGRLSREKGVLTLCRAWSGIPGLMLKIAGEGVLQDQVKAIADGTPNIDYVGHVKGNALIDLICGARFVVVPSEWHETFGLSVLESLACGTPVIAANIGAIPELVRDSSNGYLFKSGDLDELVRVVNIAKNLDNDRYLKLSVNARETAKNFNSDNHYVKLITIYRTAIEERLRNAA